MSTNSVNCDPYVGYANGYCGDITLDRSFWPVGIFDVYESFSEWAEENPDDPGFEYMAAACAYELHPRDPGGEFSCGPFAPILVACDTGVCIYPTLLEDVGDEILEVWSGCAPHDYLHPLVGARLSDLLWVRRHGDAHRRCREAIAAYVEIASLRGVKASERVDGLTRAIALCHESDELHLLPTVLKATAQLVEELLDAPGEICAAAVDAAWMLAEHGYDWADLLRTVRDGKRTVRDACTHCGHQDSQ